MVVSTGATLKDSTPAALHPAAFAMALIAGTNPVEKTTVARGKSRGVTALAV